MNGRRRKAPRLRRRPPPTREQGSHLTTPRHLDWLISGLLAALMGLTGCASLPARGSLDIPTTLALPSIAETRLAGLAARAMADAEQASGFKLLPIGSVAFQTLIELTRQAERSIDIQTFVLHGDASGGMLLKSLRDAALRGVRVRVLVDDLHTDTAEPLLSDVAAFHGIDVRLINPFVRLRGSRMAKLVSSLDELDRVNHRMHNKLLVVDNALAIIGGRNVGDKYYMRADEGENFIDLDVLAGGAVVDRLSASFDEYWNSEFSWPIDHIVRPAGGQQARRDRFDRAVSSLQMPPPDLGIPAHLKDYATAPQELRAGSLRMRWATAEVVADPVDKLAGTRVSRRQGTVRAFIAGEALGAKLEVFTVSPYYVPGRIGIGSIRLNRSNGVRLRVLTNSLASTDEPVVHAGYLEYRREMVELGVELYELSPKLAKAERRLGRFGSSTAALHMKAVVIDRKSVFLGSMNLDGRSEQYNTEVGVMIRSEALAEELLSLVDFESSAYRVELGPDGRLRWVSGRQGQESVSSAEPEADACRRTISRILGVLIPHDWL